jgi:hypothetical protein
LSLGSLILAPAIDNITKRESPIHAHSALRRRATPFVARAAENFCARSKILLPSKSPFIDLPRATLGECSQSVFIFSEAVTPFFSSSCV